MKGVRDAIVISVALIVCLLLSVEAYDDYDGATQVRDSRDNRGPIQFPMAPLSGVGISGVRAGASGYGFFPPNGVSGQNKRY